MSAPPPPPPPVDNQQFNAQINSLDQTQLFQQQYQMYQQQMANQYMQPYDQQQNIQQFINQGIVPPPAPQTLNPEQQLQLQFQQQQQQHQQYISQLYQQPPPPPQQQQQQYNTPQQYNPPQQSYIPPPPMPPQSSYIPPLTQQQYFAPHPQQHQYIPPPPHPSQQQYAPTQYQYEQPQYENNQQPTMVQQENGLPQPLFPSYDVSGYQMMTESSMYDPYPNTDRNDFNNNNDSNKNNSSTRNDDCPIHSPFSSQPLLVIPRSGNKFIFQNTIFPFLQHNLLSHNPILTHYLHSLRLQLIYARLPCAKHVFVSVYPTIKSYHDRLTAKLQHHLSITSAQSSKTLQHQPGPDQRLENANFRNMHSFVHSFLCSIPVPFSVNQLRQLFGFYDALAINMSLDSPHNNQSESEATCARLRFRLEHDKSVQTISPPQSSDVTQIGNPNHIGQMVWYALDILNEIILVKTALFHRQSSSQNDNNNAGDIIIPHSSQISLQYPILNVSMPQSGQIPTVANTQRYVSFLQSTLFDIFVPESTPTSSSSSSSSSTLPIKPCLPLSLFFSLIFLTLHSLTYYTNPRQLHYTTCSLRYSAAIQSLISLPTNQPQSQSQQSNLNIPKLGAPTSTLPSTTSQSAAPSFSFQLNNKPKQSVPAAPSNSSFSLRPKFPAFSGFPSKSTIAPNRQQPTAKPAPSSRKEQDSDIDDLFGADDDDDDNDDDNDTCVEQKNANHQEDQTATNQSSTSSNSLAVATTQLPHSSKIPLACFLDDFSQLTHCQEREGFCSLILSPVPENKQQIPTSLYVQDMIQSLPSLHISNQQHALWNSTQRSEKSFMIFSLFTVFIQQFILPRPLLLQPTVDQCDQKQDETRLEPTPMTSQLISALASNPTIPWLSTLVFPNLAAFSLLINTYKSIEHSSTFQKSHSCDRNTISTLLLQPQITSLSLQTNHQTSTQSIPDQTQTHAIRVQITLIFILSSMLLRDFHFATMCYVLTAWQSINTIYSYSCQQIKSFQPQTNSSILRFESHILPPRAIDSLVSTVLATHSFTMHQLTSRHSSVVPIPPSAHADVFQTPAPGTPSGSSQQNDPAAPTGVGTTASTPIPPAASLTTGTSSSIVAVEHSSLLPPSQLLSTDSLIQYLSTIQPALGPLFTPQDPTNINPEQNKRKLDAVTQLYTIHRSHDACINTQQKHTPRLDYKARLALQQTGPQQLHRDLTSVYAYYAWDLRKRNKSLDRMVSTSWDINLSTLFTSNWSDDEIFLQHILPDLASTETITQPKNHNKFGRLSQNEIPMSLIAPELHDDADPIGEEELLHSLHLINHSGLPLRNSLRLQAMDPQYETSQPAPRQHMEHFMLQPTWRGLNVDLALAQFQSATLSALLQGILPPLGVFSLAVKLKTQLAQYSDSSSTNTTRAQAILDGDWLNILFPAVGVLPSIDGFDPSQYRTMTGPETQPFLYSQVYPIGQFFFTSNPSPSSNPLPPNPKLSSSSKQSQHDDKMYPEHACSLTLNDVPTNASQPQLNSCTVHTSFVNNSSIINTEALAIATHESYFIPTLLPNQSPHSTQSSAAYPNKNVSSSFITAFPSQNETTSTQQNELYPSAFLSTVSCLQTELTELRELTQAEEQITINDITAPR